MEHIIVTELSNEMVRLVPEAGYRLFCKTTCLYYGTAIVKKSYMRFFLAEAIPTEETEEATE